VPEHSVPVQGLLGRRTAVPRSQS